MLAPINGFLRQGIGWRGHGVVSVHHSGAAQMMVMAIFDLTAVEERDESRLASPAWPMHRR